MWRGLRLDTSDGEQYKISRRGFGSQHCGYVKQSAWMTAKQSFKNAKNVSGKLSPNSVSRPFNFISLVEGCVAFMVMSCYP